MKTKSGIVLVAACVLSSFAGGAAASLILQKVARAETREPKTIRAERFSLVDKDGKETGAGLALADGVPTLYLSSKNWPGANHVSLTSTKLELVDGGGLVAVALHYVPQKNNYQLEFFNSGKVVWVQP